MSQLGILLRMQFLNEWQGMTKKRRSGAVWMITIAAAVIFMSLSYSISIFTRVHTGNEYYAACILGALSSAVMVVSGVSWTINSLFQMRDFDVLMSFPLKKEDVAFSRMLNLLAMLWVYSGLFLLPGMVVLGVRLQAPALFYFFMAAGWIGLPLVPAVISSLLGCEIRRLTSGRRNESLWRALITLGLSIMIVGTSSVLSNPQGGAILLEGGRTVSRWMPLMALYMRGLCTGNYGLVMLELGIEAAVFLLALKPVAEVSLRLSAKGENVQRDRDFRIDCIHCHTQLYSLVRRENDRYISDAGYLLTTMLGAMLMMVAAVAALFSPRAVLAFMGVDEMFESMAHFSLIVVVIGGVVGLLANPCSVSISLEGRHLWVLKSMPVDERVIFAAKIWSQMAVQVFPVAASVMALLLRFHQPPVVVFLGTAIIVLEGLGDAMSGLLINLTYPKLDWAQENAVYRRSLSSILGIAGGLTFNSALIIMSLTAPLAPLTSMKIAVMALIVLDLLFFVILNTRGTRLFHQL